MPPIEIGTIPDNTNKAVFVLWIVAAEGKASLPKTVARNCTDLMKGHCEVPSADVGGRPIQRMEEMEVCTGCTVRI